MKHIGRSLLALMLAIFWRQDCTAAAGPTALMGPSRKIPAQRSPSSLRRFLYECLLSVRQTALY